ncbi:NAD(P)-binding protein [Curvularia clavata]|uniref:NAD(P)-binding protein n=1 Tax=Curvularia clavata TaxID=95742 RepID=A0A9Q8Z5J4_CURCL|nr:NAD(P)-binding protein [Curvularia clavata]
MSKPILAVFGATGNQGFSVASHVLSTPSLSSKYTVRALSRNTSHPSMATLASQGAQLASADMDDASTLPSALKDVQYLFLNTPTPKDYSTARAVESRQVKTVCRAALAAGVRYIIFSSMSMPLNISNGALQRVQHFDVKAEAELYIRRLPIQSAFFAPASFMQNFTGMMKPRPSQENDGTYVLADVLPGNVRVPYIDITDTGKWVGAILAEPDKYNGKFFAAAEAFYTSDEVAEILSKVTGKTVRHVQLPDQVVKGFFPQNVSEQMFEMFALFRDYGYYGEDEEELVKWAREQVEGEVTGLEAFLRKTDYKLE